MRKIRIFEHISLDGVIEHDADYAYGAWTTAYRSPAGLQSLLEAYGTNFDLLLGRRTYDIFASFWPNAGNSPMANGLNAATKFVVTHRPESLEWGPLGNLGSDIAGELRRIKATDGPDLIVCGSSTVTSLLFEEGLVDEIVLIVYSVLLGEGKRLLSDGLKAQELSFVSSSATETGVLLNTYRYVGPFKS